MAELEQTLDSTEIADMIEKSHSNLIRDIRRYTEQFIEAKIGFNDFFRESTYKDAKGETRPCYRITKKGCEFIAHKLTGIKGTIFTARYINRFHEMQDIITQQELEPELPWFIKGFRGSYIVLWRDFTAITGYDIENYKPRNWRKLIGGYDFNGWGWKCNNEEFRKEYGFDYGTESCMMYFYPNGVIRVLKLLSEEERAHLKLESYEILMEGIRKIQQLGKREKKSQNSYFQMSSCGKAKDLPIPTEGIPVHINIVWGQEKSQIF